MGLPIIDKMLGHTQPATTARYAHLASALRRYFEAGDPSGLSVPNAVDLEDYH